MAVTPQTGTGQCSIGRTLNKTIVLTSSRLQPFNLPQYSASFPKIGNAFPNACRHVLENSGFKIFFY